MFAVKLVSDTMNGGYLAEFVHWGEARVRMEVALKNLMDRGLVVQETSDGYFYRVGKWVDGVFVKLGHVVITIKMEGSGNVG